MENSFRKLKFSSDLKLQLSFSRQSAIFGLNSAILLIVTKFVSWIQYGEKKQIPSQIFGFPSKVLNHNLW